MTGVSFLSLTWHGQLQKAAPAAWRRLAEVYGPVVGGWCRRRGLAGADVEDVVQEVFLRVLQGLARFDPARPFLRRFGGYRALLDVVDSLDIVSVPHVQAGGATVVSSL